MKKIFLIAIFSIALICFLGVNIPSAKAATVEELQTQIKALLAQIAQLQQQLAEIQGQPAVWCYDFNVNLRVEMKGEKVRALQTALQKEGFAIPVSETEKEGYFGDFTASAVVQFQEKYASEILTPLGLTHGTGYVGSATRAKLNNIYGCGRIPVKPSITVLSPNGGEQLIMGQTYNIRWTATGLDKVFIAYKRKDSSNHLIAGNISASLGTYSWTVSNILGEDDVFGPYYKILIVKDSILCRETMSADCICDESDNYFSILFQQPTPSITVLSPNGGEIWSAGTTQTIKWTPSSSGTVRLEIRKGASPYVMISSCCISDSGSYAWPVPTGFAPASDYRVRVTKNDGAGQYDESDNYFNVVGGAMGMKSLEEQLASIASAVSELMGKMKELMGR